MFIVILLTGVMIGLLIGYCIMKPYESKEQVKSNIPERPVDYSKEISAYEARISKERTICEVKEEYERAAEFHKTCQLNNILHSINRAALQGEDYVNVHYPYSEVHPENIKSLTDMGYILEESVYGSWTGGPEIVERPATKISGWATADCSQSKPQ